MQMHKRCSWTDSNGSKLMCRAGSSVLSGAHRTVELSRPTFVIDLHTPERDVLVGRHLTEWSYRLSRITGDVIWETDAGWADPEGVWGIIVATPAQ